MTHVAPVRLFEMVNGLTAWHLDAYDGMSDDEMTQQVLDETAERPEARRRLINDLSDLLASEEIQVAERDEFIAEAAFRNLGESGEMAAWLRARLDVLVAERPVARTTATDGERPTLLEIYDLLWRLKELRPEVGGLPSPADAARMAIQALPPGADDLADPLLQLMNSSYSDRDKADFLVEWVGPLFYSDLEAIEWAADVARTIQNRPRPVD